MRSHNQSVTQERFLHLKQCDSLPFSIGFQCNFPPQSSERKRALNWMKSVTFQCVSGSSFCSLITTMRLKSVKLLQSMRVFIEQQRTQSMRPSLPCMVTCLACFSNKSKWVERMNSLVRWSTTSFKVVHSSWRRCGRRSSWCISGTVKSCWQSTSLPICEM